MQRGQKDRGCRDERPSKVVVAVRGFDAVQVCAADRREQWRGSLLDDSSEPLQGGRYATNGTETVPFRSAILLGDYAAPARRPSRNRGRERLV